MAPYFPCCVDMVGGPFDGYHTHIRLPIPAPSPVWALRHPGRFTLLDAAHLEAYELDGSPHGTPPRYDKRSEDNTAPAKLRPATLRVVVYEIPTLTTTTPPAQLAATPT